MYISRKKHEQIPNEAQIKAKPDIPSGGDRARNETDVLSMTEPKNEAVEDITENESKEILVDEDPQVIGDETADKDMISYERFVLENADKGILKIQASSGEGSIPLVNVNVVVYKDFSDGRHVFFSGSTNTDGAVSDIVLPAPPKKNSELGNGKSPYASYSVSASRDGLIGEEVENVPIFSGIRSIQPINMQAALEV